MDACCGVRGVHGHGVCVRVCLRKMGRMSVVCASVEGCSRKIGGITSTHWSECASNLAPVRISHDFNSRTSTGRHECAQWVLFNLSGHFPPF